MQKHGILELSHNSDRPRLTPYQDPEPRPAEPKGIQDSGEED